MPFGVDLNAKIAEPQTPAPTPPPTAPEPKAPGVEIGNGQNLGTAPSTQTTMTPQEIIDLDKLEKFRWQNREWTQKDLQDGVLRQEDYTTKTKSVAESRKYAENFSADLEAVVENPELVDELKRIYPKSYHRVVDRVLARLNNRTTEAPPQSGSQSGAVDETSIQKMVKGVLDRELAPINEWKQSAEKEKHEQRVEARGRELDSWFDKYSKKYPDADGEVVNARALAAIETGAELNEGVLEKLFRAHHEEVGKRYAERYKKQIDEQLKANKTAQDAGPGGGTPGKSPLQESMREAKRRMEEDIAAGRIS